MELVVVVGIIAMLTALSTAGFANARKRAAQAKIIADVLKIQTGLQTYYQRNRAYPAALSDLTQDDLGGTLPKATDGGDYPYAAPYIFYDNSAAQLDDAGSTSNHAFTSRADTLEASIDFPIGSDSVGEELAYPSSDFGSGTYAAKATSCGYLRGGGTSRTYAYRLGSPLLAQSNEAARDATPCSDWFYDVVGSPVN